MSAHGGIAQLARATGSYPVGHGFKSNSRYQRPVGQAAKTPPFHGGNGSSILPRVTNKKNHLIRGGFFLLLPRRASDEATVTCHCCGVRILRVKRWELVHDRYEQKYSPKRNCPRGTKRNKSELFRQSKLVRICFYY